MILQKPKDAEAYLPVDDIPFCFVHTAFMIQRLTSATHLFVVTCKGCPQNIPATVETMPIPESSRTTLCAGSKSGMIATYHRPSLARSTGYRNEVLSSKRIRRGFCDLVSLPSPNYDAQSAIEVFDLSLTTERRRTAGDELVKSDRNSLEIILLKTEHFPICGKFGPAP